MWLSLKYVVSAGLPPGACMSDKDCLADSECNLKNTTRVCRCSGGFDTCQPPPPTGRCQLKPPPMQDLSRSVTRPHWCPCNHGSVWFGRCCGSASSSLKTCVLVVESASGCWLTCTCCFSSRLGLWLCQQLTKVLLAYVCHQVCCMSTVSR